MLEVPAVCVKLASGQRFYVVAQLRDGGGIRAMTELLAQLIDLYQKFDNAGRA